MASDNVGKGNTRRNLEFTVGEIDIDATLTADDYTAIDFIIRNLAVANDYEKDSSFGIQTRKKMAEMTSMQISFYLFCALKPFLYTKEMPQILIFGTGFVGSRVIHDLIAAGCAPYIKVYCRSDDDIDYWKMKGIKISTNLKKLYLDPTQSKPHIIILCTPLSSFSSIAKQIKPLVDRNTCFIYTTVGLLRRRVYEIFHTPSIFRTYQEPEKLSQTIRIQPKIEPQPVIGDVSIDNDSFASDAPDMNNKDDVSLLSAEMTSSNQDMTSSSHISSDELAANTIAQRSIDIRNIVHMIENYYALNGMGHAMARYESLLSMFSYHDVEYESYLRNIKLSELAAKGDDRHIEDYPDEETYDMKILQDILSKLSSNIGLIFQRQFSKHIKVMNLPRIRNIVERMDEVNHKDPNDKKGRRYSEGLYRGCKGYSKKGIYDGNGIEMHDDNVINKIFDQDRKYLDNQAHDDIQDDDDDEDMELHQGMSYMTHNQQNFSVMNDEHQKNISQRLEREAREELNNRIKQQELEVMAVEQHEHAVLMSTVEQLLSSDTHSIDYHDLYHQGM